MSTNKELWLPIKGYEGLYKVSNASKIKALYRRVDSGKCHREWKEHLLYFAVDGNGYFRTNLAKNGVNRTVKVHRIVAEAFIPNPENKPTVNHKDGNKQNNNADNLEWATLSEQQIHAYGNGLNSNSCELNPGHKLTLSQVEWIKEHYIKRDKTFGVIALAKRFNVHRKTIGRIVNGQSWKEGDAKCQG